MNQAFLDYYRCPEEFADFRSTNGYSESSSPGYFRIGSDLVCYGPTGTRTSPDRVNGSIPDVSGLIRIDGRSCFLPFDPTEVANNFRYERYVASVPKPAWKRLVRKVYYSARPALPVPVRRHLQRAWLSGWNDKSFPSWPVDRTVDRMFEKLMSLSLEANQGVEVPFIWFWPEGKSSCAIMTHDVETRAGLDFAARLMDINDAYGVKSSFQIIPEDRYSASEQDLSAIRTRGFEINVHDLKHDGHLFDNHEQFLESAVKINEHAKRFDSRGFRSGVLYRNVNWYEAFSFSYDMSVPNMAHLDPQPGGCCTVMPYFVNRVLEIPVTTTQDYSLFNIIGTYSLDLWRQQIAQIMEQHGLISFIVHPDYLDTPEARDTYSALLQYLSDLRSGADLWIPLPREVDKWWRERAQMKLVRRNEGWRVEGCGADRARVAYATLSGGKLIYRISMN